MKISSIPLYLSFLLFSIGATGQFLQVDDTYTAQQLVQDVLIDSPCANVSNIVVSGDPFSGSEKSYGYFTNSSPTFPFTSGVVLSTARAKRSEGPNTNLIDEGLNAWAGDSDLEQALGISGTYNATILEFDFTPLTSQVSFDYVFASEEYHDSAQCTYSDGFAFLLRPADGSQPWQNLAVLPNSNTPVLVTTVHPAVPGSCPAANEQYFGQYNGSNSAINYNGQTAVLTARATVVPGTTYHIKLVIADQGNIRYDSAIFLDGGSFAVGTDLGPGRTIAANNPVCNGDTHLLDATEPAALGYQWFRDSNPIPGATSAQYTATSSGTYSVDVTLGTGGCVARGEAVIEYVSPPAVTSPVTLVQCDENGDGVALYNLLSAGAQISASAGNVDIRYYPTLSDAQNDVNQIANPQAYSSVVPGSAVARVANTYGCFSYADIILSTPLSGLPGAPPFSVCDTDFDGLAPFDLQNTIEPVLIAALPAGLNIAFYQTASDAALQQNPLPAVFTTTVPNTQVVYARVNDGDDCAGIIPVTLFVFVFPNIDLSDEQLYICPGTTVTVSAPSGFEQYDWSNGQTGQLLAVTTPGSYTVTLSDINRCQRTKTYIVAPSEPAVFNGAEVRDFAGGTNTVVLDYSGIGDYAFSLSGSFQPSPQFDNVAPGIYDAFISDNNGCALAGPFEVVVMDYPKFFTPNGDGVNDIWFIKNLNRFPDATVSIFDRYGKLLHWFPATGDGWDGRKSSEPLPSSDYWFLITFADGREVRGHFTLKR